MTPICKRGPQLRAGGRVLAGLAFAAVALSACDAPESATASGTASGTDAGPDAGPDVVAALPQLTPDTAEVFSETPANETAPADPADGEVLRPVAASSIVGRLDLLTLDDTTFGRTRTLRVWLPPGYEAVDAAYPVLYLFDGQNVFDAALSTYSQVEWSADETATRLIEAGEIAPLIIVGVDNAPGVARAEEYLAHPDIYFPNLPTHLRANDLPAFFRDDVFPAVEGRYRIDPDARVLGGASYGAIAALHVARLAPGLFAGVLAESPSLHVDDGRYLQDVAEAPSFVWPDKIMANMGTHEGAMSCDEPAREEYITFAETLEGHLQAAGLGPDRLRVTIEACAIHSETAWARRLPDALRYFFPPERSAN